MKLTKSPISVQEVKRMCKHLANFLKKYLVAFGCEYLARRSEDGKGLSDGYHAAHFTNRQDNEPELSSTAKSP